MHRHHAGSFTFTRVSLPDLLSSLNVFTLCPAIIACREACQHRSEPNTMLPRHALLHTLKGDPISRKTGLIQKPGQNVAGLGVIAEEVKNAPALPRTIWHQNKQKSH